MGDRVVVMGKANIRYKNGARRRSLRQRVKAWGRPCAICGKPIDYDLPAGHPMSFEVDEIVPVSKGGDPLSIDNVQPAHRICNQRKGNKMHGQAQGRGRTNGLPVSREW